MAKILNVIRNQFLPSIRTSGIERLVVPAPSWRKLSGSRKSRVQVVPGVEAYYRRRQGSRKAVRGQRPHGNVSPFIAHWPQDAMNELRVHKLALVSAGQIEMRVHDYVLCCEPGTCITLPAGTPYGVAPESESDEGVRRFYEVTWFVPVIPSVAAMGVYQWHTKKNPHDPNDSELLTVFSSRVNSYFNEFMEEVSIRQAGHEEICAAMLLVFLGAVKRELEVGNYTGQGLVTDAEEVELTVKEPITIARSYIASHLDQPLTIERVAHAVYMSRAQFARRFHEATGETFNSYLTQRRLQKAQTLLRETEWSVIHIGRFVGLHPNRLRALFSQYLGVAPGEYRRQARAQIPMSRARQ